MTAVLETKGVCVSFGGVRALVDVDLDVGEGQLVGLILLVLGFRTGGLAGGLFTLIIVEPIFVLPSGNMYFTRPPLTT